MGAENFRSHKGRNGSYIGNIDKTGLPFDPVAFIESISDPWWKLQLLRVRLAWLRFVEWVR